MKMLAPIYLVCFLCSLKYLNANTIDDEMDALPPYEPVEYLQDIPFIHVALSAPRLVVNKDMWSCGDHGFRQWAAYNTFHYINCENRMAELNLCCAFHDNCYELKIPKFHCDLNFCHCLQKAVGKGCSWKQLLLNFACAAVRTSPEAIKSYNSVDPEYMKLRYVPVLSLKGRAAYLYFYDKCKKLRRSISTCAYNNLLCHSGKYEFFNEHLSASTCRQNLAFCIRLMKEELSEKEDEECGLAANKMADIVDKDTTEALGTLENSGKKK